MLQIVRDSNSCQFLQNFILKTGYMIESKHPDMIIVTKYMKSCIIVDVAISYNNCITVKEKKKIKQYYNSRRKLI